MKKKLNLLMFASIQILLVVGLIYKQSLYVGELYQEQRINAAKHDLEQKKQELLAKLYCCKNPDRIKDFAKNQLSMQPIALTQIKTVAPV